MRASEFIYETVNPETLGDPNDTSSGPGWEHTVEIGDYIYKAQHYLGAFGLSHGDTPGLVISAYDPNKPEGQQYIGKAVFLLHTEEDNEQWLESEDTEIDDEYQRKGVASAMYAYAKMLGNDIRPSPYQSLAGKNMWRGWIDQGHAQHLLPSK